MTQSNLSIPRAHVASTEIEIPKTVRDLAFGFDPNKLNLEAFNMMRGDQRLALTYGELQSQVRRIGNALLSLGIRRGDRIGLLGENRIEWPVCYLAISSIGATVVSLDLFLTANEIKKVIASSQPRMVFTSKKFLDAVEAARCEVSAFERLICFDPVATDSDVLTLDDLDTRGKKLLDAGTDLVADAIVEPEDIATIIFLSTTVGVEQSHRSLMANLEGFLPLMGGQDAFERGWLDMLPFHHSWPITVGLLFPLFARCNITILGTSKIDKVIEALAGADVEYLMLVPALVERLYSAIYQQCKEDGLFVGLDLPTTAKPADWFSAAIANGRAPVLQETLAHMGLDKMRCIWSAGAHLYLGAAREMKMVGIDILDSYGLTETGPIISHSTNLFNKMGAAGYVISTVEVKIDKPDKYGNGEILARGPVMMSGYFNHPDKTAQAYDDDGWFHTGDLGVLDEDGYLFITGRCKNIVVNSGGKNIFPDEIEAAIKSSDFIADAVVTPKIDGRREFPFAVIQPDIEAIWFLEREQQQRMSDQEIRKLIQNEIQKTTETIAHYKLPGDFEITYEPIDAEAYHARRIMFEDATSTQTRESSAAQKDEKEVSGIGKEAVETAVATYLCRCIGDTLKVDHQAIDPEVSFFEYLSSLEIVDIAAAVEEELGIKLYPPMLFEHINVLSLSNYFATEFRDEFVSFLGEDAIEAAAAGWLGSRADTRARPAPGSEPLAVAATTRRSNDEPVAIVGVAATFPGSRDVDEYWQHLAAGDDLIQEIPKDRFDWQEYIGDPISEPNKIVTKWGGFIDDVDKFDPGFFGISPKEARLMDPQHRKFLEAVYKAIESAGHKPSSLNGRNVGLFAGVTAFDYTDVLRANSSEVGVYAYTSVSPSVLPNRISYLLGIHGPSEAIDTACSSALVAIHRARRAILAGECEMAIAGGVNFLLTPELFISFSKAGMLSPDGRCKTFSKDANGYARGEGVGAIVLKPLGRALADGDHIYATIKGSAVNHGGRASSFTAPNPNAHAALLVSAYEDAGCGPESVSYIEAHGTGTSLGDPIEINGLKKAFSALYDRSGTTPSKKNFCAIGSVKTNIGHLEGASGIAGLVKILVAMQHETLPGILHLDEVSPYVDVEDSPFFLIKKTQPWKRLKDQEGADIPLCAGVSSFGVGGTNAHVVVEEFKNGNGASLADERPGAQLFVLSAKKADRLVAYARELANHLKKARANGASHAGGSWLRQVAYTLQVGRDEMNERLAVVASSVQELHEKLSAFVDGKPAIDGTYRGSVNTKDEEAKSTDIDLEAVTKSRDLDRLSTLWVGGVEIPWRLMHNGHRPKRLPLPTYPFAQKRYWVRPIER